ncbi:uncharacterized protein [Nicotiana tomentosiformis]|uniref:uncharacterized protein n=1 Tax=Nicotiana tomentosiformis TaxID=4098 RepID=UPI00388C592E
MDTFSGKHFNLNVDLIFLVLIPHIEASIRYEIKECITFVHLEYGYTINKRKAFLGRKRAFEIVYSSWDKSFASLPRYVFWAFKPAIDGFVHCRPVISIDDTHVYGKYDIKLLIAVEVDANGSIFLLAFAIFANESQETWTLFLNHLKEHVVRNVQEPYAYHRYCVRHLKANFQKAHSYKDLHELMWMAATDHQECKFRRRIESIRMYELNYVSIDVKSY